MTAMRTALIVAACGLLASSIAMAQGGGPAIPTIRTGYPDETVTYEGEEALSLVRKILPAAVGDTAKVIVREMVGLPSGTHGGVTITITHPRDVIERRICTERRTVLTLVPEVPEDRSHDLVLDFSGGSLAGYSLSNVASPVLYRVLAQLSEVPGDYFETCNALGDGDGWIYAASLGTIRPDVRRRELLLAELPSVRKVAVECVGTKLPPCDGSPADVARFLDQHLPYTAQQISLPDRRSLTTYTWGERDDDTFDILYQLVANRNMQGRVDDVRLKISRQPRPVI